MAEAPSLSFRSSNRNHPIAAAKVTNVSGMVTCNQRLSANEEDEVVGELLSIELLLPSLPWS